MMPKLPPPYGVLHGVQVWHGDDLLAYARAVAEACAKICESRAVSPIGEAECAAYYGCADAIREAAKELGK